MSLNLSPGYKFHKAAIESAAGLFKLDALVVAALVWQESNFNTDAFRHEPDFWNRYMKNDPRYKGMNPRRVSSSYGLAQTMYCRLLEDHIAENDRWEPELLFVPSHGLSVGCQLLRELIDWATALPTPTPAQPDATPLFIALAAYNGGRGGNDPNKNWPLRNGKYAREVLAKYDLLVKEYAA